MSAEREVAPEARRAWRYEVIDSWGSGATAIGESPFIVDWKNLGKEYTWTIYDFAKGEVTGTITGRLLDKGYVVDGDYKSDAELGPRS